MLKKIKSKYYELLTKVILQPFTNIIIDTLRTTIQIGNDKLFKKYLMYGYMLNDYAINKDIYLD